MKKFDFLRKSDVVDPQFLVKFFVCIENKMLRDALEFLTINIAGYAIDKETRKFRPAYFFFRRENNSEEWIFDGFKDADLQGVEEKDLTPFSAFGSTNNLLKVMDLSKRLTEHRRIVRAMFFFS